MKFFKFLPLIFFIFFSCKSLLERKFDLTSKSYEIRVLLKNLSENVTFYNKNGFKVVDFITNKKFNIKEKEIKVYLNNNKIFLNSIYINSPIVIYARDLTKVNDRYYFGYFKIVPEENSFYVINYIPIEAYLISVLPSEVPISFNIEALKAQAIVARTYSYYFMTRSLNRDFDVDDTTSYQVYNGFNPEFKNEIIEKIFKAIKGTEGLIITYNNDPIIAYFHANSGGKITSGKEYFGSHSDFPYLVSKEDPYSVDMPSYKWEFEIDIKTFLNKLNINDQSVDIIQSNFIYNENGFVKELTVNNLVFTSKEIRRIVGYAKIKSEKFKVSIKNGTIVFDGYGYGHGVGLSQWGAENMARKKKKFSEIIKFYYPDTKIESF